ncbi:cyclopropane-fatty-acyl-phospholipid synthase family protein [Roseovarius sp. D0-M9]|uniref:cyclopropane-fatty-acyl-phospholipid synthase family protein n=1 Tax=Roseovarius sp. D0-M9 TaxID=3127117 RepID=UPI00300FE8A3
MKNYFTRFLDRLIATGDLSITYPDGDRSRFGDGAGKAVSVEITDRKTLFRLATNPELALGEAYMDGTLRMEKGSVYDLLEVVFRNTALDELDGFAGLTHGALKFLNRLTGYNSLTKSKMNVAHHYDLSGDLYRLFLDSDSQYSCAYFESAQDDLEEAQLAKKRHLAAKLLLDPRQKVLDVGSGWGGLGLYLAQHKGVDVTGVTLSEEQFAISNSRAQEAELNAQARFELRDYRTIQGRFDRIVSVGMFEHVGPKSYDEFFSKMHELLEDDGVMTLHYIGQTTTPSHTNPWIVKYIFPGGYIPSLSEVLPAIERSGLMMTDVETLRLHYAETLKHWRERFMARRDEAVALYDERFARMWEFYLASSETGFRYQGLVIHQIQLARRVDAVPLTRTYIDENKVSLRESEKAGQTAAAVRPLRERQAG